MKTLFSAYIISFMCIAYFPLSLRCESVVGGANYVNKKFHEQVKIVGPLTAKKFEAQDVTVTGPASLENAIIKGVLSVTGPLKANSARFAKKVVITGPVSVTDASFSGPVEIVGPLIAKKGEFAETVELTGPLSAEEVQFKKTISIHTSYPTDDHYIVSLSGSTIDGDLVITVQENRSTWFASVTSFFTWLGSLLGMHTVESEGEKPVKVKLKHTVVHGSIIFKKGDGIVEGDEASKIIGGIKGGKYKG